MGLIIKDKLTQLKKGYPTVSDKYNVQGGVYVGEEDLYFGDLVAFSGVTGHYEKLADDTVENIAGICLATNVKLINKYPGDTDNVATVNGEAFNLLVRGFVAVAIAVDAEGETPTKEEIAATLEAAGTEGAPVYVNADGKFAVDGDNAIPNAYFMGVAEVVNGEVLAEINYRM